MPARRLDGSQLADTIRRQIAHAIEPLKQAKRVPHLVAVHVGHDEPAILYAQRQQKACEELGFKYSLDLIDADTTTDQVIDHLHTRNADDSVSSIILLLPVPDGIDSDRLQQAIDPRKDAEGMSPANLGLLVAGRKCVAPCTPLGAMELLLAAGVDLADKHVVVVGASNIVGKPAALLLMGRAASVTVCRTSEKDLPSRTRTADVIIAATGKPNLITADRVKPGAVVIDVGINRVPALDDNGNPILSASGKPKKKTVGDVAFESVSQVADAISPVPGGTGPMTVAMLLRNCLEGATPV